MRNDTSSSRTLDLYNLSCSSKPLTILLEHNNGPMEHGVFESLQPSRCPLASILYIHVLRPIGLTKTVVPR